MKRRILLADDHQLMLDGMTELLGDEFEIVGTARNGHDLVASARRLEPDVIVSDYSMPGLNGVEAYRRIRAAGGTARLVIVTMHDDPAYAVESIDVGASAVVLKHSAASELKQAIHAALAGDVFVTPRMAHGVMKTLAQRSRPAEPGETQLTHRQREILKWTAAGLSAKEVAYRLGISSRTVEYHKAKLRQVLGLSSSAELIRYAIEQGLAAND